MASLTCGVALHVMYDSRIGFRHAQLFRKGIPAGAFGFNTERRYALDAAGEPVRTQSYSTEELTQENEYETVEDALTQGLRALGLHGIVGADLVQLISYPNHAECRSKPVMLPTSCYYYQHR